MGAIWSVRLNLVADVADICTLPSGACTDARDWLFNCLATTSAAEILGAARVPFALVRSVWLSSLSVSFPCVSLGEKGMRKIPLVLIYQSFQKTLS